MSVVAIAREIVTAAHLLRQGHDAEAMEALLALHGRLKAVIETAEYAAAQRRQIVALLLPLSRLHRGGDSIGLADLLEHRLAPLLFSLSGARPSTPPR